MSLLAEPVEPAEPMTDSPESAPVLDFPVRRVSFEELLADLPRYFAADGNIVLSHFLAALSAVFPPGEDFFVRSVRHYRGDIADPVLAAQVRDFIGQEAIHGREHRALNDRLDALGYRVRPVERFVDRRLRGITAENEPLENLAITAAIEHFTAVLGEVLLGDAELRASFDHDGLLQVFSWHALEECEHKSVAFDVYRHIGGDEATRRRIMNRVLFAFMVMIARWTLLSIHQDGGLGQPRRLLRDLRAALATPLFRRNVWRRLRAYNREGFHPTDIDTDGLVRAYREILFGDEGTLVDQLVAARS